jgi:riboflavin kinase/FMN adenylyltransferase
MTVHYQTEALPDFRNAVITIGTFDGVHTGHQQIIKQLTEEAKNVNGESVIITFHPHPRKILSAFKEIKLINTIEEKIELLAAKEIDHLIVIPFTEAFSQLSAEEYITHFLVAKFHPHTIIIGYDHRFGKGRKGDYHLMEDFSERCNYRLLEIPAHVLNEVSVSSTRIREAIIDADISTANELLGYDFFFEGLVVEGNKLGRTIGYPTANLKIINEEKLVPGNGVYAVELSMVNGQWSVEKGSPFTIHHSPKGMMNVGNRPTINGTTKIIEVNIFDFDEDIYGKTIRVYLKKYLRSEQKFSGLDALKEQLAKDKEQAILYLKD